MVSREFVFSEHAILNFRELTYIVSLPRIFLIIPPWIINMVFDHLFVVYDPFLVFVNDVHNLNVIRDKRARKVYGSRKPRRNRTKLSFSYPKTFSTSDARPIHITRYCILVVFSSIDKHSSPYENRWSLQPICSFKLHICTQECNIIT